MELKLYKTLWGHKGTYQKAIKDALNVGFNGIEGPLPQQIPEAKLLRECISKGQIEYIAEVCTAGSYVPDREASLEQHLNDLACFLDRAVSYQPKFVTCLGGCDAWSLEKSLQFFERAMKLAHERDLVISFETHRGRSLFNPWITQQVLNELPSILLTCDFSHWCVVCERLVDTESDIIRQVAKHAHHIHARVGYDQGPQVPHPAAPEYEVELAAHQSWWEIIWREQYKRNYQITTMTPEFGPDGYLHLAPFTQQPVADLWQINCWMADNEKQHFQRFRKETGLPIG